MSDGEEEMGDGGRVAVVAVLVFQLVGLALGCTRHLPTLGACPSTPAPAPAQNGPAQRIGGLVWSCARNAE